MKRQIGHFFLLLFPAAFWGIAVSVRPSFFHLRCLEMPETCSAQSVFWLDRFAIQTQNPWADRISFITQDLSAVIAALVLFALIGFDLRRGKSPLRPFLTGWLVMLQTVAWNGLFNEITRFVVQRPRPFVYIDPARQGGDPAHYTSFYSGHTSFATAVSVALVLWLARRGVHRRWVAAAVLSGATLSATTAIFRVLSGRHFPTDTMVGAVAGALTACAVATLHRLWPSDSSASA